jgi:hypothetical protein
MAWHKIAVLGLLASAAFAGCTVTTDDPDEDDGGSDGSGGSSSGGTKATGGSSSGGAKASGGSSSGGKPADGGPATCGSTGNDCLKCVKEKCCEEYIECGDDPACSQSSGHPGELICIQDCLIDQVGDAAAIDVQECAGRCAEDSSGVSGATSDLIACIRADDADSDGGVALQNCSEICFGAELP